VIQQYFWLCLLQCVWSILYFGIQSRYPNSVRIKNGWIIIVVIKFVGNTSNKQAVLSLEWKSEWVMEYTVYTVNCPCNSGYEISRLLHRRDCGLCEHKAHCNNQLLASLIVNCSRVYKARPTACLAYFHLRRTSVVCVLEHMVTCFQYVSRVSVKTLLFPDAYFVFL